MIVTSLSIGEFRIGRSYSLRPNVPAFCDTMRHSLWMRVRWITQQFSRTATDGCRAARMFQCLVAVLTKMNYWKEKHDFECKSAAIRRVELFLGKANRTACNIVRGSWIGGMQVRFPSQEVRRYSSNGAFINRSTVDTVL